ncbi:MAG: Ferrichrome receptor FcuA [Luteibacter sp.]|nr:MAG: Ferrichrome receptor FcuA [Luteibacter sp.]
MSLFGEPMHGLRLLGGLTYIDARLRKTPDGVNEGNPATGVPNYLAKLNVEWDVPGVPGLTLTGRVTRMSKQYVNPTNTLSIPGYTLWDAGARYAMKVGGKDVTLRASVANLTNKAYWASASYLSPGVYLGAPRTVLLSASMDF